MNPGSTRTSRGQAPDHQTGAGQEHQREGQVDDDQQLPRFLRALAHASACIAAQTAEQTGAACPNCRHQPKQDAGCHREQKRKRHDHAIEGQVVDPGYVDGHYRRKQRKGQRGESKAERAASPAEHHALGQQLSNQPTAPGAERGAHSHFARAIHRAREHQIRNVRARDQQHEPDGGQENIHPAADGPAEQLLKRNRAHAARGIVVRKLAAQTRPHAFEISGRLCQCHIRADSPDRLQVLTTAARIRQVALVAQNGPELCALVEVRTTASGSNDAGMTPTISKL